MILSNINYCVLGIVTPWPSVLLDLIPNKFSSSTSLQRFKERYHWSPGAILSSLSQVFTFRKLVIGLKGTVEHQLLLESELHWVQYWQHAKWHCSTATADWKLQHLLCSYSYLTVQPGRKIKFPPHEKHGVDKERLPNLSNDCPPLSSSDNHIQKCCSWGCLPNVLLKIPMFVIHSPACQCRFWSQQLLHLIRQMSQNHLMLLPWVWSRNPIICEMLKLEGFCRIREQFCVERDL